MYRKIYTNSNLSENVEKLSPKWGYFPHTYPHLCSISCTFWLNHVDYPGYFLCAAHLEFLRVSVFSTEMCGFPLFYPQKYSFVYTNIHYLGHALDFFYFISYDCASFAHTWAWIGEG